MKKVLLSIATALCFSFSGTAQAYFQFSVTLDPGNLAHIYLTPKGGNITDKINGIEFFLGYPKAQTVTFGNPTINQANFPGATEPSGISNQSTANGTDPSYNLAWFTPTTNTTSAITYTNGTAYEVMTVQLTGQVGTNLVLLADNATGSPAYAIVNSGSSGAALYADPSSGQLPFTTSQQISGTYYRSAPAIVLPVTLLSFNAIKNNSRVDLRWVTGSETNSSSFVVERSATATAFSTLTTVAAVGSGANRYSAVDASPLDGVSFYRLKMVDKDGASTYSGTVSVGFPNSGSVSVYPSPAHGTLNVNVSGSSLLGTQATLIDLGGRSLKSLTIGAGIQQVDVSTLSSGVYFLKLADGSNIKFVKN